MNLNLGHLGLSSLRDRKKRMKKKQNLTGLWDTVKHTSIVGVLRGNEKEIGIILKDIICKLPKFDERQESAQSRSTPDSKEDKHNGIHNNDIYKKMHYS